MDSTGGDNPPAETPASVEPFPSGPGVGPAVSSPAAPAPAPASGPPASVRRHRRSRRTVRQEDISDFRREFLGIDEDANCPELEGAFNEARMSLSGNNNNTGGGNNGNANANAAAPASGGGTGSNSGAGLFNFFDNNATNANANASPMSTPNRSASTTPIPTAASPGGNGAAASIVPPGPNIPQNAGHQMDLNYLYSMVLELSDVLKNNRDMTRGIIRGAEELMVSHHPTFLSFSLNVESASLTLNVSLLTSDDL